TILYTYPKFWDTAMGGTTEFGDPPLWIASYNGQSAPEMPHGGWSTWTFWQYTDSGQLPGIPTPVDLNRFNGTTPQLQTMGNASGTSTTGTPGS
ncbi:GH25 family lysozyme, partial [Gordonia sp. i37]|uniref:GH25 family lysozyme n=1 Tax=Gordonia sp. i37 TaxID=1961707 RepID=UPI0009D48ECD